MSLRTVVLTICTLAMFAGCDKPDSSQAPSEADQASKEGGEASSQKFSATLKVSGTQATYETEGALKPEEVQKRLLDAIHATDAFAPDGGRKLQGRVTYDIKPLEGGEEGYDLVLLGNLGATDAAFQAGVNYRSNDEKFRGKPVAEMVEAAIDSFATRIGGQARVLGGSDKVLGEILANTDEPEEARLMAIQEIRERKVTDHLEIVRAQLKDAGQPGKIRLASAATLASLGDEASRAEILALAEHFSRERDPQFVPMLHILGDLGGDEVRTYIEAVADGHAAPAVRDVARDVLTKMK